MALWYPPEEWRTDRLTIRSYHAGDGEILEEAVTASYDHLKRFMDWARNDQSVDEWETVARRFRARYLMNEDFTLLIVSPDGKRMLGGTGFHLREGPVSSDRAEIGMWIRADESGSGLGTAALVEMLRWGFNEWPWKRLSWLTSVQNFASVRTAEKAGMIQEGIVKQRQPVPGEEEHDRIYFAAFRKEWKPPANLHRP